MSGGPAREAGLRRPTVASPTRDRPAPAHQRRTADRSPPARATRDRSAGDGGGAWWGALTSRRTDATERQVDARLGDLRTARIGRSGRPSSTVRSAGPPHLPANAPAEIARQADRGRPLARADAHWFETRFGRGFDDVRVHDDHRAAELARAVDARAFTVGTHVFFGAGQFAPGSPAGRGVLAHELAHIEAGHGHDGRIHRGGAGDTSISFDEDEADVIEVDTKEKFEKLQVYTTGLDAGAKTLAAYLNKAEGFKNVFVGLYTKFIKVYDENGDTLAKISLQEVKGLHFTPGVYIARKDGRIVALTQSTKDPTKLSWETTPSVIGQRPYTEAEKKEFADEVKKAEAEGREPKPPPSTVLNLPKLMSDEARYRSLVEGADKRVFYFAPTYEASDGKGGKEGGQKQLYASPIEGRGDGKPANAPPWPVKVEGPKLAPVDSTPTYSAKIDWSAGGGYSTQAQALAQLGETIHYKWERFDITQYAKQAIAKDPAKAADDPANKPEKTLDQRIEEFKTSQEGSGSDVTGTGAAQRNFTREFEDWWKDTKRAQKGYVDPTGDTRGEKLSNRMANELALELAPLSLLVTAIGAVVRFIAELFAGPRQQQEVEFEKEGIFLVRAITTPAIHTDHEGNDIIRPPSVDAKVVEVTTMERSVQEALDEPGAQLAELQSQIDLAEKAGNTAKANYLRSLLVEAKARFEGTPVDVLRAKREQKQKELEKFQKEYPTLSDYSRKREVEMLDDQINLADFHEKKRIAGGGTGSMKRVNATLISEVTAEQYPLLLSAGPMGEVDGKPRWLISDVTNRDGDPFTGVGDTPSEAFHNALIKLGGKAAYGRGTIGARTAGLGLEAGAKPELMVTSAPTDWALAEKRIDDLVMTLAALGLIVASAGTAGALIGATVAAARLIERWANGKLYLDAQTVSDLLGVLGGIGAAGQLAAGLRIQKLDKAFVMLKEGQAVEADILAAGKALNAAQDLARGVELANEAINYAGVIWGNVSFVDQMMDIAEQERNGTLTHAAARRQRASAISSAVQNNGLFIAGNVIKAKQAAKANEPGGAKPGEKVADKPVDKPVERPAATDQVPSEPTPKDSVPKDTVPKDNVPKDVTPTDPAAKQPGGNEPGAKEAPPQDKAPPQEKELTPTPDELGQPGYAKEGPLPLSERRATIEELRGALPKDVEHLLRIDETLEGDDVRVDFTVDKATGLIDSISIRCSPDARPSSVKLHTETVRTMQKYQGFAGRVRLALSWVSELVGVKPDTPNPENRESFAAALEIQKLPKLIEEQVARMKNMEPNARDLAEAELAHLEEQLAKNLRTLELGSTGDGEGFVAGKGLSKAKQKQYAELLAKLRNETPGSDPHMKIRREMYELIGGDLPPTQWENVYRANMKKATRANEIVKAEAKRLGWGEVADTTEVSVGEGKNKRRLDIADEANRRGVEVKAYEEGKVYNTDEIESEVKRDAKLVKPGGWDIKWLFIDCTPSGPLQLALHKAGITIEVRTKGVSEIIPPPAAPAKTPAKT